MSNPPYGVDWKQYAKAVTTERDEAGPYGRFAPGLPATSDGQMLFLLHLAHKMRARRGRRWPRRDRHERLAAVQRRRRVRPSNIRQWLLENDLVEAIVALPTNMFFNTGIATYIWILDNTKHPDRKGMVQLIDGTSFWTKMRKNLGAKSREISDADRAKVVKLYADFTEADPDYSKVCATTSSATGPSPSSVPCSTRTASRSSTARASPSRTRRSATPRTSPSPTAARPPAPPARSRSSRRTSTPR